MALALSATTWNKTTEASISAIRMTSPVQIIDLFSGPGGLGEGFTALQGPNGPHFRIAVSVEKEPSAHATLRLRAFLRQFPALPREYICWLRNGGEQPDWATAYPTEWAAAAHEAQCLELGSEAAASLLEERIARLERDGHHKTLLIGGPPCQAYSLVGRARNAGVAGYEAAEDHRNFLYEEYVRVLNRLKPVAFVMENVKGMLSSSVAGKAIFQAVTRDLRMAGDGYRLFALSSDSIPRFDPGPKDFIVRAEDHGIPQARHRVIIIGIRSEIADVLPAELWPRLQKADHRPTVTEVIGDLPPLRSGLSRADSNDNWAQAMLSAIDVVESALSTIWLSRPDAFRVLLQQARSHVGTNMSRKSATRAPTSRRSRAPTKLELWLRCREFDLVTQHETRGHMAGDLARYLFAACHAQIEGTSPKADMYPVDLAPDHRNWQSGKFNDRFRVQLANQPSTTITSHISKDGHYFIHPDPFQCRSLTVREAARLQTFPDDYLFLGNRTQQYVQVGNAVPPFLAHQIAEALRPIYDRI
jgi:DNA (cytosine-5)-methyltransferase 1